MMRPGQFTTRKILSVLNGLVETCRNGQWGYETAAEAVKSPEFASLCREYARQRAQFAQALEERVRRLGGNPEHGGTAGGAAHRGWMQLKAAATQGDEAAIIAECERGEDVAKRDYEEALQNSFPEELERLIAQQYEDVRAAHDRIRLLEQAHQAT